MSQNPKTTIGTLGGAAVGGLIAGAAGASRAGTAAGVVGAGSWVGSSATCWTNGIGGWRTRRPSTLWRCRAVGRLSGTIPTTDTRAP